VANLKDLPVLFIDCQTTGASPQHGQIIELGWAFGCAADEDAQVETRLIALPDGEQLPLRISRLTGITGDDMLEALPAKKVVKELRSVAAQLPQPQSLAIAHYSRFEETFLQSMFAENSGGDKLPLLLSVPVLLPKSSILIFHLEPFALFVVI
jgi:DNA polymerase III, alpha subunit (gram-positive type)